MIPPAVPAGNMPPVVEPAQPRMVRVQRAAMRPVVTYAIMAVTVLVYLLQELSRNAAFQGPFLALAQMVFGQALLQQLLAQGWGDALLTLLGGKISPLIDAGQYWRLLTPMLLHASLVHIGFNMYALFAIGPSLESYYGHGRFFGLYLLGGLGGNILSYLLSPGWSVGASTAIFGLVAAEGVFVFQNRAIFGKQARAMLGNVVLVVVINLGLGLSPGIDNWGHLGGLITGLAFAWFAGPHLEVAFHYPDYELVDQRPAAMTWMVGMVIFLVLVGIVFLRVTHSAG